MLNRYRRRVLEQVLLWERGFGVLPFYMLIRACVD